MAVPPKPGAPIHDVAKAAGVSTKSTPRVMNGEGAVSEETRQRILNAIAEVGYVANPAARRMRGSAYVIGLIMSGFEAYAGEIMRGMSQAAQHLGYNLVLYVQHNEANSTDPYQPFISSGLIDGVLMIFPYAEELLIEMVSEYEL